MNLAIISLMCMVATVSAKPATKLNGLLEQLLKELEGRTVSLDDKAAIGSFDYGGSTMCDTCAVPKLIRYNSEVLAEQTSHKPEYTFEIWTVENENAYEVPMKGERYKNLKYQNMSRCISKCSREQNSNEVDCEHATNERCVYFYDLDPGTKYEFKITVSLWDKKTKKYVVKNYSKEPRPPKYDWTYANKTTELAGHRYAKSQQMICEYLRQKQHKKPNEKPNVKPNEKPNVKPNVKPNEKLNEKQ